MQKEEKSKTLKITIKMSATRSLLVIKLFLLALLIVPTFALSDGSNDVEDLAQADNAKQQAEEEEMLMTTTTDSDGWSPWAEWSPCSRSCDGGISHSIRKCNLPTSSTSEAAQGEPKVSNNNNNNNNRCLGPYERYRLCNIQPCSATVDFRAQQCASFNERPYRERYYRWLPYIDPVDPCSLTCRAEGVGFVAKLEPMVKDGTRCKVGALDMCVAGRCLSVGCDLEIGSDARIDECGICGGDGRTCQKHTYRWWHYFPSGRCTKACGGGTELSEVVCMREDGNNTIVDEIYCSSLDRFHPETRPCNTHECPPEWSTGQWSGCNRVCGEGVQKRVVTCALVGTNGSMVMLDDGKCGHRPKPPVERKCNPHECPKWYSGSWGKCSGRCGDGVEVRPTECRDAQGLPSDGCDEALKPLSERNCTDTSYCPEPQVVPGQVVTTDPSFVIGPWRECNVTCGMGYKNRTVQCQIYLEFSQSLVVLEDKHCRVHTPIRFEACYEDSGCFKDAPLLNPNFTEPSSLTVVNKFKIAMMEEYENRVDEDGIYEWQVIGYTECTESCLGGVQDTIIACIDLVANVTVDNVNCVPADRPDIYTRVCNQVPCPPHWNLGEWSNCSKQCGADGFQVREVQCYHQLGRGIFNLAIIEDEDCPQPKPVTEQSCNRIDCQAKWYFGPWSACSSECGGGKKTRAVRCMREFAVAGLKEVSVLECSGRRPKPYKSCNIHKCLVNTKSANESSRKFKRNHSLPQFLTPSIGTMTPADAHNEKKITIKVSGEAKAPEGGHLRLVCPMTNDMAKERFGDANFPYIFRWFKDNRPLASNDGSSSGRKFRAFRNILVVRGVKPSDAGVYKCVYEMDFHTMFLHVVKAKPTPAPMTTTTPSSSASGSGASTIDAPRSLYKKVKFLDANITFLSDWRASAAGKQNEIDDQNIMPKTIRNNLAAATAEEEGAEEQTNYDWITTDWSKCTIKCSGKGFRMRAVQCYMRRGNITEVARDVHCFEVGRLKPHTIEGCGFEKCKAGETNLEDESATQ